MIYLFSDYDGTFKNYENNKPYYYEKKTFEKNIKYATSFMNSGNIFTITTGRNTENILNEIKKYNINFNYITAYDGLVTIDKNGNVVYEKCIEKDLLNNIKKIIQKYNIDNHIFNNYGLSDSYENIVYIKLYTRNERIYNLIKELIKDYNNVYFKYEKLLGIITIHIDMNKSLGIKELLKYKKVSNSDKIVTVGDSTNDLEMINDYEGYKMLISHPKLYLNKSKTTTSVNKLIKKLTKS